MKLVVSRKRLLPLVSHSRAGSAPDYDSPCKIPLINMSASCDSLSLDQPYLPSVINFNRICNTEELQLKHVTIVKVRSNQLQLMLYKIKHLFSHFPIQTKSIRYTRLEINFCLLTLGVPKIRFEQKRMFIL